MGQPNGEFELIARLRERLPGTGARLLVGSGDDAAVAVAGGATATSVDAVVDGVHFRLDGGFEPEDVGAKALATALSDLAAMGAEPGEAYVVLGVPPAAGEAELLRIADGLAEVATATGTAVAGGDVVRSPVLWLALTVVGHAPRPELLVTRAGAEAGDVLVLSGELGGAAAGLLLLERPALADVVAAATAANLRQRQLRPTPRLRAGAALAAAGARAMIDLSDGLAADAGHVAARSGVALAIDAAAIPLAKGVAELAAASGQDPLELAVSGGEDYELLAAIPPDRLGEAATRIGDAAETSLTVIGEVTRGGAVEIRLPGGGTLTSAGFDQLAPRPGGPAAAGP
ncbi:MAG: thiamine-phosphate kinase [Actinobacteria bacterium]|nr:thiamine-phosphate kinase [Actinomycetota bacterium]